jgi:hypothetical protein
MAFIGEHRENKTYIFIAIMVIIIIVISLLFSSRNLTNAYIEDRLLEDWPEDIFERDGGSQTFGLEKWNSFTYRNNNVSYPAYITVTSFKTLFMMSENELLDKTIETIIKASTKGIIIDEKTRIEGTRVLKNNHKTTFIIYNATDLDRESIQKIKIIGETWNCGNSGTSIICIGVAWITNNSINNSKIELIYWSNIINDKEGTFGIDYKNENGLIYNIKCH